MSSSSFLIAPSILSADFAKLGEEIKSLESAGADWVHVDVMDGHFVPNLTIGAPVVKALRPQAKIPLDVHLMIDHPEKYLDDFIAAGSDYITIHIESTNDVSGCLKKIKDAGKHPGITLRPKTPLQLILPYLEVVDLVLVMTVEPGFGGQKFMSDQVEKISELKRLRKQHGYSYLIEVDGGVNGETAEQCKDADVLVAGNFVFKFEGNNQSATVRYRNAIKVLKAAKK